MSETALSINTLAGHLVDRMVADAAKLRIAVSKGERGETIIDAGKAARGGIDAGLRIAEICLGGLGTVELGPTGSNPKWPFEISVRATDPVIACLASQYAGWALSHGEGKGAFFALGSGPGRALARKEPLFNDLAYHDHASRATLVLESDRAPPPEVTDKVAAACGVSPENLAFIFAPTQSLAGGVQVVSRVLEVVLHKAHELKFPLERIIDGVAAAPLSPPHPDFIQAMGRTNDAIIYAGQAHLFVTGPADEAKALAEQLPSTTSRDHGQPFAEIFKKYKGDFYAIDPMLFSPAQAIVTAVETGETFRAGRIDNARLDACFS
ncbi:Methenyltetrahydromethanopterin cyclohydrolase (methenyl-H4MPT cyclohydrolase) [Methylocella tundrae]|uniref:Methenyltetrahydromethanopterin cyclohydrolase n=2 Tax=Methylocella tundrae TaxID=227605 RepID=A0A8B6M0Z9_METTU|nr:Methenyltetrahydromethanopterin cyclohydrolase (methenyl-H4MPT cyclohydrolase) [Methylocella tundrae]